MHSFLKISIVAVAMLVGGCVIVPEQIEVSDEESLISFESIINGSKTGQGEKARWGGEIVSVENKKDYSEIEILQYPSNQYGKPRTNLDSAGRFKVQVTGFIDPLVFEKGRLITFLGELGDPTEGIIGEQAYVYPVLLASGYYMWKETEEYQVSGFYYSQLSPYWGVGLSRNYWRPYGFYQNRTVIRVQKNRSKSGTTGSKSRVISERSDRTPNKVIERSK
ncbi:MAG: outer membrane lipoprotein [Bermanella sp.]|jgi:outer membrane lipoprotein|uniref:Slp family lipoprotein n=1 Tax=Glaciecola sp. 33A TaxID=2057807 RepID=UPI000C346BDA|nr:Slp family lipoprotein [Glaciecola sp. 33A]PKH99880.1 starvation-inducible outer membrane lipoprotein [Glaciecola sp. 33A]